MSSIATGIVSCPETVFLLGMGLLWGLLVLCAGGILLTALRGRKTEPLAHWSARSQTLDYQWVA